MNHLTAYAYEEDGKLFLYRCPERSCGSVGEPGSYCGGHDAPPADPSWRGPKRVRVLVPEAGEEPRFTLEQVRAGLLSKAAVASAWEQVLEEIQPEDVLPESRGKDRTREVIAAALVHFTQQPAGVGAGRMARPSREARGARENPVISADSDGNQQPLGGDADRDRQGNPAEERQHVAGGGSAQQGGLALAEFDASNSVRFCRRCNEEEGAGVGDVDRACAACGVEVAPFIYVPLTQLPSDGQEGGVGEEADRG
jgi:hypothetical protein